MNKSVFCSLIFVCSMIFVSALTIKAQNETAFDQGQETTQTKQPKRPNLLRELELSPNQIQQIRQINQERKMNRLAAQQRLKEANEALDGAVYGERDNDAEVQARLRDVHAAQLEVLRNRVSSEQSIRRVLTPQQLGRFRQLQRQYKQPNSQKPNAENGLNSNPNRNLTPRQKLRLQRQQNIQRRANP